jgi:hypothetical protein
VGTYLGSKKVFNLEYGFFHHANGAVVYDRANYEGENVSIQAVDAFLDHPVGKTNAAITAYVTHQINNYGHVGCVFAGDQNGFRLQPYVALARHNYDGASETRNVEIYGLNFYLSGHHSKFTFEYSNDSFLTDSRALTIQAMIYL